HPAEIHDSGLHVHGAGPDYVVHRDGRRCDETHRSAHDRRHLYVVFIGTGGLSGSVRGLEMAFRIEKTAGALLIFAATAFAQPFRYEVRHQHLHGGGLGMLRIGLDSIAFEEQGKKHEHSREWKYADIQQLSLSPTELRVLTYEDQ